METQFDLVYTIDGRGDDEIAQSWRAAGAARRSGLFCVWIGESESLVCVCVCDESGQGLGS
jgi:hypothetical protein